MQKLLGILVLGLLFFPAKLYADSFSFKGYALNVKKMQIKSKKMKTLLNETILKISEDCCEKNFENKDRLLQIKINMNRCLEEECHKKSFLFYKKKPQKLLALEQIEESKNLLLKNSKLKYENAARIRKEKRLKEEEEKRLKEEEEKRLKEEEEKRLKAEEASRLKEEVKLEETSIKDQEQVAENNKKKALHESIEREKAEKLKKIGITKRKNK